jgi:hypothetical protein
MAIAVSIQFFEGCPSWEVARAHLEEAASELGVDLEVELERVDTLESAQQLGFTGSPTIRIDGRDPFSPGNTEPGLNCRLYATPNGLAGAPTTEQLVAVLAGRVDVV